MNHTEMFLLCFYYKMPTHLGEPRVKGHRRVAGVLCEIQICGSSKLLLNDKRLLQQLKSSRQKLVFNLEEVSLSDIHLEGFVYDAEAAIVLYVLPPAIAVSHDACGA